MTPMIPRSNPKQPDRASTTPAIALEDDRECCCRLRSTPNLLRARQAPALKRRHCIRRPLLSQFLSRMLQRTSGGIMPTGLMHIDSPVLSNVITDYADDLLAKVLDD